MHGGNEWLDVRARISRSIEAYCPEEEICSDPVQAVQTLVGFVERKFCWRFAKNRKPVEAGLRVIGGAILRTAEVFPSNDADKYIESFLSPSTIRHLFFPILRAGEDAATVIEDVCGLVLSRQNPRYVPLNFVSDGSVSYFQIPPIFLKRVNQAFQNPVIEPHGIAICPYAGQVQNTASDLVYKLNQIGVIDRLLS